MNGTTGYEAQFSWKWVFGVDGFLCRMEFLVTVLGLVWRAWLNSTALSFNSRIIYGCCLQEVLMGNFKNLFILPVEFGIQLYMRCQK